MSTRTDRVKLAILKVLLDLDGPAGASRITEQLTAMGINLQPRTVRLYLLQLDREGLTRFVSRRRGREITDEGREELAHANVVEKVGFVAPRVDALGYQMSFSVRQGVGSIVVNVAVVDKRVARLALENLLKVFEAGFSMGTRLAIALPGDVLAGYAVPDGKLAIGTVCSVTVNGILLQHGIPVNSRFGGLVEVQQGKPARFVELIDYRGTTVDPLEAFIRADMTSVRKCCRTGNGLIGASFREVPAVAIEGVQKVRRSMVARGLEGVLELGTPSLPLLEVPVAEGRVGIAVVGGLNPIAAISEAGIRLQMVSLAGIEDSARFTDAPEAVDNLLTRL